jgi:transcriptional regulator with XRE-family HTH domain
MVTAPPVRRRLVGKALRRHRERLGYTLDDAARMLDCDRSKASRIETGARGIRHADLEKLLAEYGIPGDQRAILRELADPRGAFGWHRDYADILPGAFLDYAILETAASRITTYEAQRVPVLLQSPEYARALARASAPLAGEAAWDRATKAVLARQEAILGDRQTEVYPGRHRPAVHLVIGQAALHQQIGSDQAMDEQLRVLARVAADSGTVTVQVMQFEAGPHAAAGDGSVEILQFSGVEGLGLVHIGGIDGGVSLEGEDGLAAYAEAFDQLRALALSPAQSALLLSGMAGI